MRRIKKLLAMLMAMTMVLGMGVTAFAAKDADGKTTITVKNLTENATVNVYQMFSWDESGKWVPQQWAIDAGLAEEGGTFNASTIQSAVEGWGSDIPDTVTGLDAAEVSSSDVTVTGTTAVAKVTPGAYLIKVNGSADSIVYNLMIANTVNGADVYAGSIVVAKGGDFSITKTIAVQGNPNGTDHQFVKIGDTISFEVKTFFPDFKNNGENDTRQYFIKDYPTGMKLANTAQVTIGTGGTPVTVNVTEEAKENGKDVYKIDLSNYIGTENANAGKTVTVTYTATITGEAGDAAVYNNSVQAFKVDAPNGGNPDPDPITPDPDPDDPDVDAYTGIAKFTKYDETGATALAGAEFEVKLNDTAVAFVKISDGIYRLATDEDTAESKVTNVAVAAETVESTGAVKGMVELRGLGVGAYNFKETKAPVGYALDSNTVKTVPITQAEADAATANIVKTESLNDSKLATLPSTGGIGTTIFTIGGCALMIIAAGLYFASRRKTVK